MDFNYYVYVYLDPLKPKEYSFGKFHFECEPFYIGMGRNERIHDHIYESKKTKKKSLKNNKILKILKNGEEPIRYKLYENISKYSAKRLEKYLIKLIGRRDLNQGTLTNMTDGGDGSVNYVVTDKQREMYRLKSLGNKNPFFGKNHTEETLKRISDKKKGKGLGQDNPNFGNNWTEEEKQMASIRQKDNHKHLHGDKNPSKREDVRQKISEGKMGLKNPNANLWKLVSPENEVFMIEGGMKRAIVEHGLTYGRIKYGRDGNRFYSKDGWQLFKIVL